MFWKRPVLPPAASFLLIASVCAVLSGLRVNDVWADDHSSVAIGSARGTDAGEFVITLAGRCTLSSFRLPDRDWPGIHVHELPGMNYRGFVELPGEHCRVLSSPTVQSRFIVACASGGMDQLFTIDDATLATHAILQPGVGKGISQVARSGKAGYVVAVVTGFVGGRVAYDRHFRCRGGGIAVPQLRKIVD